MTPYIEKKRLLNSNGQKRIINHSNPNLMRVLSNWTFLIASPSLSWRGQQVEPPDVCIICHTKDAGATYHVSESLHAVKTTSRPVSQAMPNRSVWRTQQNIVILAYHIGRSGGFGRYSCRHQRWCTYSHTKQSRRPQKMSRHKEFDHTYCMRHAVLVRSFDGGSAFLFIRSHMWQDNAHAQTHTRQQQRTTEKKNVKQKQQQQFWACDMRCSHAWPKGGDDARKMPTITCFCCRPSVGFGDQVNWRTDGTLMGMHVNERLVPGSCVGS